MSRRRQAALEPTTPEPQSGDAIIAAHAPRNIDDLVAMLKQCGKRYYGYSLHNLFERSDGGFQANVRHGQQFYDFAVAETPFEALRAAFAKALDGFTPPDGAQLEPTADDEDLIG